MAMHRLKELMLRPTTRVVDWTEEERQGFLLFSKSVTGRKFLEFLRQHASTITFGAVRGDGARMNAYARGVQDTVLMITNMAAVPDVEPMPFDENLEPLPSQKRGHFPRGNYSGI